MFIPRILEEPAGALATTDAEESGRIERVSLRKPRRRRGATAMEYLVVASFILVVLISAVQYFGSMTSQLMGTSATATAPK